MIPHIDVDLELVPRGEPGFVRRSDLIVVHQAAVERVCRDGGVLRACEVLVVVKSSRPVPSAPIMRSSAASTPTPGSRTTGSLDPPATLIDCHLTAEFGYQDPGPVTGRFVTTEPFPVGLRLVGLLPG